MMASDGEPETLGTVFAEAQATGVLVVVSMAGSRKSFWTERPDCWPPSAIQGCCKAYPPVSPGRLFLAGVSIKLSVGLKNDLISSSKLKNRSRSILLS